MDIHKMEYGMQRKPSSEFRLHAALYRKYPGCNAIIHTHSNGISTFAAAHAGLRITEPPLDTLIGDIRCSEYQEPGTDALCDSIMNTIDGSLACIIANHGAIFYSHELDFTLAIADAVESRACNILGLGQSIIPQDSEEDVTPTQTETN